MWKITSFGLKSRLDLKNRAAHPQQEFSGAPPRSTYYYVTKKAAIMVENLVPKGLMFSCSVEYSNNKSWRKSRTSHVNKIMSTFINDKHFNIYSRNIMVPAITYAHMTFVLFPFSVTNRKKIGNFYCTTLRPSGQANYALAFYK